MPAMTAFQYLTCDGGPHIVLPAELSQHWKGANSALDVLNPASDYGRACASAVNQKMSLLPVGNGHAIVLASPPMSAWGRSPEQWVDIYSLESWRDMNLDALIARAVVTTPTTAMTDSGHSISLTQSGLILLFAGDRHGDTAYGEHPIPIEAGTYQILIGHYKAGISEDVYIYRLRPISLKK